MKKNSIEKLKIMAKNLASPPGGSRKKPEEQMLETQKIYNQIMALIRNCGDLSVLYDPGFTGKAREAYAVDKKSTQQIIQETQVKILNEEMIGQFGPPNCDRLREIITEGINKLNRIIAVV
jgi:hypothetical protein